MERNMMQELIEWKSMGAGRMPLLLHGVRQVGKTYILRELGDRYFQNTVYINFERMRIVSDYFQGELSPDRIIRLLEEYFNQKIIPERTLLIFDEIQACERALTALKYFCEEAPEYHIAAAGSLLGVAINREKYSFPVGKVLMKTLYPLGFDEFLRAVGKGYFVEMIREHYSRMQELSAAAHQELSEWYYRYLYIGGMPAAVNEYLDRGSLINVPEIQSLLLNAYTADMAKYTTDSESTRIRNAYMSMPAQLAKENKKFQYKLIRKGATAGLFGDSIAEYTRRIDMCIDHHPSNSGYADCMLLDGDAAATAEIIYELLTAIGTEITPTIADCLYTGLSTDTGCFKVANTTAGTHEIAAKLITAGASLVKLNNILFESKSRSRLAIERLALESLEYSFGGRCATVYLTKEQIAETGADGTDLEGITSLPRMIEGVEVGITIRQQPTGSYKVSVRTVTGVDASAICAHLGGGGHKQAAGCELLGSLDNAKAALLTEVEKALCKES